MDLSKLGYTKPLYILPFDHRSALAEKMFNLSSVNELSPEQSITIKNFKDLIYRGFKKAIEMGVPKEGAAILCDEQFGNDILIDARNNGFITMLTIEKSGQSVFELEYGYDFEEHIDKYKPTFAKVLIKYNPSDPEDLKQKQKDNLKILNEYTSQKNYKFILEVLVLPNDEQLAKSSGSREEYDEKMRPELTINVIQDLHQFGIEPDVWKLEGFDQEEDYKKIVEVIREDGRGNVGLVILGRGAGEEKVDEWLKIGARVDGVIGFAVGRTVFWQGLEKYYKKEIREEDVVETVARNFYNFYNIFTSSKR